MKCKVSIVFSRGLTAKNRIKKKELVMRRLTTPSLTEPSVKSYSRCGLDDIRKIWIGISYGKEYNGGGVITTTTRRT